MAYVDKINVSGSDYDVHDKRISNSEADVCVKPLYYHPIYIIDVNLKFQGKQIGSAIISEAIDYLKSIGKTSVRLAIDKGNPQSTHFWRKNGFEIISEADVNGWTKLVAEKQLLVTSFQEVKNIE